jgi:hypothetical protein
MSDLQKALNFSVETLTALIREQERTKEAQIQSLMDTMALSYGDAHKQWRTQIGELEAKLTSAINQLASL